MRSAEAVRNTKETQIAIALNLDGQGNGEIQTPIGFFNHMLELFAFHSGMDLSVKADGDVDVDDHHLVEDTGILLGTLIAQALGDKCGIRRYGNCRLPMDESLAQIDLDFSGRPYLVFEGEFHREAIQNFSTEMVEEFLRAFAFNSKLTLQVRFSGKNDHHQIEAIFKGLARAVKEAVRIESDRLPSTKGVLE
ncbi:imidazoleglycerol-phosphate dehydratase HisB [Erysipelotrichaceae bacterium RD49]|nr:imidazoleglycerol-phosphate dehydratase HisB [Erysipelotrichaceae bacterium RD49]